MGKRRDCQSSTPRQKQNLLHRKKTLVEATFRSLNKKNHTFFAILVRFKRKSIDFGCGCSLSILKDGQSIINVLEDNLCSR